MPFLGSVFFLLKVDREREERLEVCRLALPVCSSLVQGIRVSLVLPINCFVPLFIFSQVDGSALRLDVDFSDLAQDGKLGADILGSDQDDFVSSLILARLPGTSSFLAKGLRLERVHASAADNAGVTASNPKQASTAIILFIDVVSRRWNVHEQRGRQIAALRTTTCVPEFVKIAVDCRDHFIGNWHASNGTENGDVRTASDGARLTRIR